MRPADDEDMGPAAESLGLACDGTDQDQARQRPICLDTLVVAVLFFKMVMLAKKSVNRPPVRALLSWAMRLFVQIPAVTLIQIQASSEGVC